VRYRIEQESGRDASGNYIFRIYSNDRLVARYWHDYRGDEHGIEFVTGKKQACPGQVVNFITGGGAQPLALSEQAASYLDRELA
jgi:hypothetical protein